MGVPCRLPGEMLEEPEAPDLDPEISTPGGHRVRAVLVEPDDLVRGGSQDIEIRAMVRCEPCAGKGCAMCDDRGATLDRSNATVRYPAGTEDGESIVLEGRGDVPGLRNDVPRLILPAGRGDVRVRVGTSKKETRGIERADRRSWKRQQAYLDARAIEMRRLRRKRRGALAALAVFFVVLGGFWAVSWLRKGDLGASCDGPRDCHSGLCIESIGFVIGEGSFRERSCSRTCTSDADCSSGTRCIDIEENDAYGVPTGKTVRACGHL